MSNSLRVLFIGENGPQAEAAVAELRKGGFEPTVETVQDSSQLTKLLEAPWDIALSDFHHSDCGSLEALRLVEKSGADVPVVALSGKIGDADVLAVLKAGACDHIDYSNLKRLNAVVERELRSTRVRQERARRTEQTLHGRKMEALARLGGSLAHDFNNLLTIITGYSDLILGDGDLNEGNRSALDQIRRSSERATEMTTRLLAFSRPQPAAVSPVHINQLLRQMEEPLREIAGANVQLKLVTDAAEDTVNINAGRLEQVIKVLATNACDAMPGGGKLTVGAGTIHLEENAHAEQAGVAPGHYVVMVIADTGSGMDGATKSRMFEPYFTTKRNRHGGGLGLATAYSFVRQLGGSIRFESELGKGTEASIYLPMAANASGPQSSSQTPQSETATSGNVLLVAEDGRARKLILGILGKKGYGVIETTGSAEALQACKSRPGNLPLAVIDVASAEKSYLELAGKLTAACPGMQILCVVSGDDEAALLRLTPQPSIDFLKKPFAPDALLRKVREAFESRSNTAH